MLIAFRPPRRECIDRHVNKMIGPIWDRYGLSRSFFKLRILCYYHERIQKLYSLGSSSSLLINTHCKFANYMSLVYDIFNIQFSKNCITYYRHPCDHNLFSNQYMVYSSSFLSGWQLLQVLRLF